MLSDGKVDAGDAPMPAAQIDVTIHDNNAADPTDIGGVGYLYPSYKTEVYSRDGLGSDSGGNTDEPGQRAQPLCAVLLAVHPGHGASGRTPSGSPYGAAPPSGIDASGDADGFNGFLVAASTATGSSRGSRQLPPQCVTQVPVLAGPAGLHEYFRPLPYGYSSVSVYTDEAARPT